MSSQDKLTYDEENLAKQAELKRATDQEIAEYLARLDITSVTAFEIRANFNCTPNVERALKFISAIIISAVGISVSCDLLACWVMALINWTLVICNMIYTRAEYKAPEPTVPNLPGLENQKVVTELNRNVYKWLVGNITYNVYDQPEDPDMPGAKKISFKGTMVTEYELACQFQAFQKGLGKKLKGAPITITKQDWGSAAKTADAMHNERERKVQEARDAARAAQLAAWAVLDKQYRAAFHRWVDNRISFLNYRRRVLFTTTVLMALLMLGSAGYAAVCPGAPVCNFGQLPTLVFEIWFEFLLYEKINVQIEFEAGSEKVYEKSTVVQGFSGLTSKKEEEKDNANKV